MAEEGGEHGEDRNGRIMLTAELAGHCETFTSIHMAI